MNRDEAIAALAREQNPVLPGQSYTIAQYEAPDGPGVARLFYTVYGEGYPIDTYYIPEKLTEENRVGNIRSVVARTDSGDVLAHIALYRSSPLNPCLFEIGVGLTHPLYRSSMVFFKAVQHLLTLVGHDGVDGFYGEAVCNHVITQKLAPYMKAIECGLEPALMPAEAYSAEHSADGRVGCMAFARVVRDERRTVFFPAPYRQQLLSILGTMSLDRTVTEADAPMPFGRGIIEVKRFDSAAVARCHVTMPGNDLRDQLAQLEMELCSKGYALIQFFVDLGVSWSGALVQLLREKGYCFGGFFPIWFGTDALLMQKHFVDPDFQAMKIYSDQGRVIFDLVKSDWDKRLKES